MMTTFKLTRRGWKAHFDGLRPELILLMEITPAALIAAVVNLIPITSSICSISWWCGTDQSRTQSLQSKAEELASRKSNRQSR